MISRTKKQTVLTPIKQWMRRHPRWSLCIIGAVLISAAAGATFLVLHQPGEKTQETTMPAATKPAEPVVYHSLLTGSIVETEAATTQPATSIMIENSPDARPQSGLKESGVVFEAIAEGGITRFLAVYQQEKPQLVGPVRSLRSYYVDWLTPFDASVAHVGGSAAALATIRNGSYRDIDQFFNAGTYWRANDRWAPHNVYTSFERLDVLNASKGFATSNPKSFTRHDSKAIEPASATSVSVTISGPAYNSSYLYNSGTNTYDRSQAGAPHLDREAGQISPRVVVVLETPMTLVREDGLRQQYTTLGSGKATIFQDGTANAVTWHKATKEAPISFTNAEGADVPLARGQTWVTVVPTGTGGVAWQ